MLIAYLAAPYSSDSKDVVLKRVFLINRKAAELMQDGYVVFSPVSHSHGIADHIDNHLDQDFWLKQDLPFIDLVHFLFVYKLPGWTKSKGIKKEIIEARKQSKKIVFIEYEGD